MKKICFVLILFSSQCFSQAINFSDLKFNDSTYYYNNDIFTGEFYELYDNGLRNEGYIKDGKLDSILKVYDRKKVLLEMIWFESNKIIKRRQFINSFLDKKVITLKDDLKDGLYIEYYPSGITKDSGYYSLDKPVGNWTYWDKKGRKTLEIFNKQDFIEHKIYNYKKDSAIIGFKYYTKEGIELKNKP